MHNEYLEKTSSYKYISIAITAHLFLTIHAPVLDHSCQNDNLKQNIRLPVCKCWTVHSTRKDHNLHHIGTPHLRIYIINLGTTIMYNVIMALESA